MQPNQTQQDAMLKRLARIEGQLRGVQKLIREQQDCEKVLQQLSAARKALDKSFVEMIACLLETCLAEPHGKDEQLRQVRELLSRYA
jgi:DNA-binding FrmR family transcriptional regulator